MPYLSSQPRSASLAPVFAEHSQVHSRHRINPSEPHSTLHVQRKLSTQEQNLCLEGLARTNCQPDPPDEVGCHSDKNG